MCSAVYCFIKSFVNLLIILKKILRHFNFLEIFILNLIGIVQLISTSIYSIYYFENPENLENEKIWTSYEVFEIMGFLLTFSVLTIKKYYQYSYDIEIFNKILEKKKKEQENNALVSQLLPAHVFP